MRYNIDMVEEVRRIIKVSKIKDIEKKCNFDFIATVVKMMDKSYMSVLNGLKPLNSKVTEHKDDKVSLVISFSCIVNGNQSGVTLECNPETITLKAPYGFSVEFSKDKRKAIFLCGEDTVLMEAEKPKKEDQSYRYISKYGGFSKINVKVFTKSNLYLAPDLNDYHREFERTFTANGSSRMIITNGDIYLDRLEDLDTFIKVGVDYCKECYKEKVENFECLTGRKI